MNPTLAKGAAGADGGDASVAPVPVATSPGTTTVLPLGKGKGKGKGGKGKGGKGQTGAVLKVWERALTKDEGLLTPR